MSGNQKREDVPGVASIEYARGPSKDELRQGFARMRKLEWVTLIYQIAIAVALALIAGGSQAMKTEWIENSLAVIPPLGVLLTVGFENRAQDKMRPFGYHRAGTVAFAAAAFAIAALGLFLFVDAGMNLLHGERPAVGGYTVWGHTFWHGWLMIGAMGVTAIPQIVLGKMKGPVAILLHDKTLHADAEMQRANWMTNGAGVIGLLFMAFGFWWGDSLAALLISIDIMRDGFQSVCKSLSDVMDHHPTDLETGRQDPIVADTYRALKEIRWLDDCRVLMREHGRWLYVEIFVVPRPDAPPAAEATRLIREAIMPLDWRIAHAAVELTDDLPNASNVLTREELDLEAR